MFRVGTPRGVVTEVLITLKPPLRPHKARHGTGFGSFFLLGGHRKLREFGWPTKKNPEGTSTYKWVFPKIVIPQNGWFIMENPIKMYDLGVPLFLETPKYGEKVEMIWVEWGIEKLRC